MQIPRLVLAGSSSGVGKTSISCGIIRALQKAGYAVQPFKAGPDYIDPGYLSAVSGNKTGNLDVWLMGKKRVLESFVENSGSDVSLVEGVMGYFDGFSGDSSHYSTYHIATILKAPVILVLDAGRTARSIAAAALGFIKLHRNSRIQGVILNRLGSPKHEKLCRQALESVKIPVLGCIPKNDELSLDSRHLGLVPAAESKARPAKILKIAEKISNFVDTERLVRTCKAAPALPRPVPKKPGPAKATIAVALDSSFNFYYRDNLKILESAGAKIKFFSPVADSRLPKCDGLYIGGGFPEIRGQLLAKNLQMKRSVKKFAEDGMPVYAECGGLMYLTDSIAYGSRKHAMVGLISGDTHMSKKLKLNYTKAALSRDCLLGDRPKKFHGHEFHYSEIRSLASDSQLAYDLAVGDGIGGGRDGLTVYNTLASYGHLYFDSKNAEKIVGSCVRLSRR